MVNTSSQATGGGGYSLTEACALIGCARSTLNQYVLAGRLPATRGPGGHWYLGEGGLALARSMVHPQPRRAQVCSPCLHAGELLYAWKSGAVSEMAPLMGIVEGNVRKHLRHLAKDGYAMRQADGDWALTPKGREWMAEQIEVTRADHVQRLAARGGERTGSD